MGQPPASDRYAQLTQTSVGGFVVKNLGLPNPKPLRRFEPGQSALPGPVLVGGHGGDAAAEIRSACASLGLDVVDTADGATRFGALVFDATGISSTTELVALHDFFSPVGRSLLPCGRVVVVGRSTTSDTPAVTQVAQRALEGFTRSFGKEIGRGSTVQLVMVADGAEDRLRSTLRFLLSARSAYVSGQVVRIGTDIPAPAPLDSVDPDADRPLDGRVALVTGASRGIGAAIAETLHRDGATIVGLDVPQAADELQTVMDALGGERVSLDITATDAPQRIRQILTDRHGGVDIVVHNAGITRDKKLVNMPVDRWTSVIDVNVHAPERITAELVEHGVVRPNGRIVGVASIAGIAGNAGQTNYAASKAGVIGLVEAWAPRAAAASITVNAVAPGFIETQMTAKVPLLIREAGRRMNSMAQGGLPVDVAETIAWFAHPGSYGITGNVVRVCGQSLLGA
jgi:3-oxoacyl-[acyl-carrier protein] reductase